MASTLLLRHLSTFAQIPLTVAIGDSPRPEAAQRVVSADMPADMLLPAVAPGKAMSFSSFDFSRQTVIPFHNNIRALPGLGRLAGHTNTLSPEALLVSRPDLVIDCGNADETRLFQAG